MPISVVVADDERLVRHGLRAVLSSAPDLEVVGEAADGAEAITLVEQRRPDVALVDVRMPHLNGIEATRRLTALPSPPAVVVLTSFDIDHYVVEALRAGAAGFLLKDAPESRLLAAVRSAHQGVALVDARLTVRLLGRALPYPREEEAALRRLTPRERDLLVHLASGDSNAEIAARLRISEATVKTHVSRILAKLGLTTRVQAVVVAFEAGLVPPRTAAPDRRAPRDPAGRGGR